MYLPVHPALVHGVVGAVIVFKTMQDVLDIRVVMVHAFYPFRQNTYHETDMHAFLGIGENTCPNRNRT
ncbi:hypothetical protein [Sphingobacterium daejeonense]|uniref:hypothetical protein n=1 Tax=Sphingobacterium daejeonense TaxID=371142 RepID=UPI001E5303D2|nr:hypothetical protein [Sphingobacterium daejeonense]